MLKKKYDVALSFAGEDRTYVEAVANALQKFNLSVFYDKFEEADLVGRNLVDHLSEVYQNQARICVLFISAAYGKKPYPRLERQSAQARALVMEEPYIIPVRLDDAAIPGLLPTIAYVSGKTPDALAHLISSKLLLQEPEGIKVPDTIGSRAVIVRFSSLFEPDMATFDDTLQEFKHWSPDRLSSIPVELRTPSSYSRQIGDAKAFQQSKKWVSGDISDEAREQFSKFYDQQIPKFFENTIKGIQRLIGIYNEISSDRLNFSIRRYLTSRNILLGRLLMDMRLVGMSDVEWGHMFAQFAHAWSERIMYGLQYACYLDGDERFFWVDVDGRDDSRGVTWQQDRFRLFAPAELLFELGSNVSLKADQFDRFFAVQFLEHEQNGEPGYPLAYFAEYPDRLKLIIRGEWGFEGVHFKDHGTSNFRGEAFYESIRAFRGYLISKSAKETGSDELKTQSWLISHKIKRLFRDGNQFDHILV